MYVGIKDITQPNNITHSLCKIKRLLILKLNIILDIRQI